jgi:hypothetical protein
MQYQVFNACRNRRPSYLFVLTGVIVWALEAKVYELPGTNGDMHRD